MLLSDHLYLEPKHTRHRRDPWATAAHLLLDHSTHSRDISPHPDTIWWLISKQVQFAHYLAGHRILILGPVPKPSTHRINADASGR